MDCEEPSGPNKSNNHKQIPEIITILAEAVTLQTKVANMIWLSLILLASYALMPRTNHNTPITLPFGFGIVDHCYFFITSFFLLFVLYIAFCVAYLQSFRTSLIAQKAIDKLAANWEMKDTFHLRDVYDSIRLPSLFRVAPLAQMVMGNYQFYNERRSAPFYRSLISGVWFFVLKCISISTFLIVPTSAIVFCYININNTVVPYIETVNLFINLALIIALLIFIFILYIEIKSTITSTKAICARHK